MISCEYCEVFKNTYFEEYLRTSESKKAVILISMIRKYDSYNSKLCLYTSTTLTVVNKKYVLGQTHHIATLLPSIIISLKPLFVGSIIIDALLISAFDFAVCDERAVSFP